MVSARECAVCCRTGVTERHHVAGAANHATLTVTVCKLCHATLTRWHDAAGIELRHAAERTTLDRHRAVVTGTAHAVALALHHASEHDGAARLRVFDRIAGAVLEAIDPDRPGAQRADHRREGPWPRPANVPRTDTADAALTRMLAGAAEALLGPGAVAQGVAAMDSAAYRPAWDPTAILAPVHRFATDAAAHSFEPTPGAICELREWVDATLTELMTETDHAEY